MFKRLFFSSEKNFYTRKIAQSAETVEHTDSISAEE